MQKLCQTVYGPLRQFCEPLDRSFPGELHNLHVLEDGYKTNKWDLIVSIGPGCTKSLLVAALSKDDKRFFNDETNEFVAFIGGRRLYDRLTSDEKEIYWSNNMLSNIIRQTMVLYALYPMTEKLQAIVEKVMSTTSGKNLTQTDIINTLISDPSMMMSMLSLMESPESMKLLMSSLKTIVDGMMTSTDDDVCENDDNVDECDDNNKTVDDTIVDDNKPSSVFKRDAERKKRNKKKRKKKSGTNPLSNIIDELSMDDKTIESMTNDIKTMDVKDITKMAKDVSKLLNTGKDGNGTADMLTNLMGVMSKMDPSNKSNRTDSGDSLNEMMSQLTKAPEGGGPNPLSEMMSQLTTAPDGGGPNPLSEMMSQLTKAPNGGGPNPLSEMMSQLTTAPEGGGPNPLSEMMSQLTTAPDGGGPNPLNNILHQLDTMAEENGTNSTDS